MNDFVEIGKYTAVLLRRWWVLLLGLSIGAAAGYFVSQRITPVYQATAALIVGQSIQSTTLDSRDIQTSERLALTYAEMAQRQPVLQGAIDALGLEIGWQRLRREVQVQTIEGTQLLEVTAEGSSPEEAEKIADEIARQLILLSPTAPQNQESEATTLFIEERLQRLQERIESAQDQIETIEQSSVDVTSVAELSAMQDEIEALERLITDWEGNYARLLTLAKEDKPVNFLSVIVDAQARRSPIRPVIRLNTILAGAIGLFLAIGIVFVLEYLDDTIKVPDDLNEDLRLRSLGTVAQMKGKTEQEKLINAQGVFSPVSEAYRMIRTSLLANSNSRKSLIFMVTSAMPGEGKSTTVANLGIVMAQAGLETIIIDSDLRWPKQHEIFQLPNHTGLANLLQDSTLACEEYLTPTNVSHLRVLVSGSLPPNPSEILGDRQMTQILTNLKKVAQVIIFDTPPVTAVTDAAVLASAVDGVIFVIRARHTPRPVIKSAVSILRLAKANIIGSIINRVANKHQANYYRHHTSSFLDTIDTLDKSPLNSQGINKHAEPLKTKSTTLTEEPAQTQSSN